MQDNPKNKKNGTPQIEKDRKNLEEQFKKLGKNTKVPDDLKKEIFSTLDTLNLFADIADLFTIKFSLTKMEALGISTDEEIAVEE